jgi:glycine cleavage system H protein
MSFQTPANLRYLETHEWVREENGEAIVGISDYAQHSLGDIVYIDLPQVGDTFGPEEIFGVIESVKASSDLYTPVGGEVVAVNTALVDDQEPINKDPYGQGWLIRLKPSGTEGKLLDAAAYEQVVASQDH